MKNLELTPCKSCGNPFFKDKNYTSDICENCILLEQRRKRTAPLKLDNEVMGEAIEEMRIKLNLTRSSMKQEDIKKKIKSKSDLLSKSVELLRKFEETGDESYIEEYQRVFQILKTQKNVFT